MLQRIEAFWPQLKRSTIAWWINFFIVFWCAVISYHWIVKIYQDLSFFTVYRWKKSFYYYKRLEIHWWVGLELFPKYFLLIKRQKSILVKGTRFQVGTIPGRCIQDIISLYSAIFFQNTFFLLKCLVCNIASTRYHHFYLLPWVTWSYWYFDMSWGETFLAEEFMNWKHHVKMILSN